MDEGVSGNHQYDLLGQQVPSVREAELNEPTKIRGFDS